MLMINECADDAIHTRIFGHEQAHTSLQDDIALKLGEQILVQHSSDLADRLLEDSAPGLIVEAVKRFPADSDCRFQTDTVKNSTISTGFVPLGRLGGVEQQPTTTTSAHKLPRMAVIGYHASPTSNLAFDVLKESW